MNANDELVVLFVRGDRELCENKVCKLLGINEINFEIEDKTQFEALENHIHLVDNVKKSDFCELIEIGKILGGTQLNALKSKYPDKEFCVFVTVDIGESMIIRFHQVWENEPVYYNPDDFNSGKTKVLMFRK